MHGSDGKGALPDNRSLWRYHVEVGGDVSGQLVIGDHNLVVNAHHGSKVTVRSDGPPKVSLRVPVGTVLPRSGPAPLGRDRELAEVAAALDQGLPVQIHGSGGSGRSTLLRHLARERATAGDPVIFLSALGFTVDDLLQELFDACYETDGYRPEPARMRRLMGPVRALLVIDDFDDDLARVLDATPACDVLVASHERSLWSGGQTLELGGLREDDGVVLIARELGRDLAMKERAEVVHLCRIAAGNPLALVQAAAAMRAGAGTLAEFHNSEQVVKVLARGLTDSERRVLRILHAVGAAPVSPPVLAVLAGADCGAAVTGLVRAGLAADNPLRLSGEPAHRFAATIADGFSPARMAEMLTAWLAAGPSRAELNEAVPATLELMRATMRIGAYRHSVALARVASPRFASALRIGAWGELLDLGRAAARAGMATADEAYFHHETAVRLVSIGQGALAGASFATAAALWQQLGNLPAAQANQQAANAFITQPAAPPTQPPVPPRGVGHAIRTVLTKPAVAAFIAVAGLTGAVAIAASGGDEPSTPAQSNPSSTTVSAQSPTSSPGTSVPPTPKTQPPEERSPVGCVPGENNQRIGPIRVGSKGSRKYTFHSNPCHPNGLDTANMRVQGKDAAAFSFTLVDCQTVTITDPACTIDITFEPPAPGTYEAEIFIPEAGPPREQAGHGLIPLQGEASEPPTSSDSPTTTPKPPTTTKPPPIPTT